MESVETSKTIFRNLSVPQLVEHALANGEGKLGSRGEIICLSGQFTGRSPKDKFFVDGGKSSEHVCWGSVNQPVTQSSFDVLYERVLRFLSDKNIYVFEGYCGADPDYRLSVRFFTQRAWHAHFVNNMFISRSSASQDNGAAFEPNFTVINACDCFADDYQDLGLNSETFIIFDLARKLAIIGGTQYAGEMKKGIFSVMNYFLPLRNVLPMHCSANKGENGDVALFFGLSGTGKTTLSADPKRQLIGDDEHGWSDKGVFNFEGGCYAKTVNLSREKEPQIWDAIRFGAVLENVVYDSNRNVDFDDTSITENTRVSYPIEFVENYEPSGCGGHPSCIVFLTCDAFGVLPPVAKLTPEQASYHFLSGYTAKVAGTELGITEPQVVFSTCFGSPFMTQHPRVYGDLLAKKMKDHQSPAYLVNTGWTAGPYGKGHRMNLSITRSIINAVLDGSIAQAKFRRDPVFGFEYAVAMDGIDEKVLEPADGWSDKEAYASLKSKIAKMFVDNFAQFVDNAQDLVAAGPKAK